MRKKFYLFLFFYFYLSFFYRKIAIENGIRIKVNQKRRELLKTVWRIVRMFVELTCSVKFDVISFCV